MQSPKRWLIAENAWKCIPVSSTETAKYTHDLHKWYYGFINVQFFVMKAASILLRIEVILLCDLITSKRLYRYIYMSTEFASEVNTKNRTAN